jgi:hypothetical protein
VPQCWGGACCTIVKRRDAPPFSAEVVREKSLSITDLETDSRLWEYDISLEPSFSRSFLKVTEDHFTSIPPSNARNVIVYYTVAFPSSAQRVDLDEQELRSIRMRTNWAKVQLLPDPEAVKLIDTREYMRCADTMPEIGLAADGFSGAPVFAIYQSPDLQSRLAFCGLITHGSEDGRLAIYPATRLFSDIRDA